MKPIDQSVPRITNEGLALVLGGRTYGDDTVPDSTAALKQMHAPAKMQRLVDVLLHSSSLLALPRASTQNAVYGAYGDDLKLLNRYRKAFETTVHAALHARAEESQADAHLFIARMAEQVSEVVHEPTLDLGPDALKLDPAELLARLQDEFRADAESLKDAVAVWLHLMAESEYVSVIEWFNPSALRYHFFRMDSTRNVDQQKSKTGDIFVGRTVTTTTTTKVEVFNERRVHTVVGATSHVPADYRNRVPKRIAQLINEIPPEVMQFVTIIDGTVSKEEVHRRVASSKVDVETKSVYTPDPALALFDTWAINGWGGSTPEASNSLFRGHVLEKANRVLAIELVGCAVLTLLAGMAEGRRGSIVVGIASLIMTGMQQLGMRLKKN